MSDTTKDAVPLKPCPMCGAKPRLIVGFSPLKSAFVDCECGVTSPIKETADEVVSIWNRRAPAQVQEESVPQMVYPAEFTEDLQWILGLICFQCITYAQALRRSGRDIPNKAEAEQAATLDWMLRHYLRNPAHWREAASAEMRSMAPAPSTGDQS